MRKAYILIFLIISLNSFATLITIPKFAKSIDFGDINLDGDIDMVVGHKTTYQNSNPSISLLYNDSYGNFELADTSLTFTGNQHDISFSYINSDDYLDLVCLYTSFDPVEERYIRVFYNEFSSFTNYSDYSLESEEIVSGKGVCDANSDGLLDVFFVSNNGYLWGLMFNEDNQNFSEPDYYYLDYPPQDITSGDLNGDQRDDILVSGYLGLEAWLNFDTGLEYYCITDSNHAGKVHIFDVDNDGDNDIITFRSYVVLCVFRNDGDGNFNFDYEKNLGLGAFKSIVADFNNDDYKDIAFSNLSSTNTFITYNDNGYAFHDTVSIYTGYNSEYQFSADFDNNGANDLAVIFFNSNISSTLNLLYNDGSGNFYDEPLTESGGTVVSNYPVYIRSYPNPFNADININFCIDKFSHIQVDIFDIKGRKIKSLVNEEYSAGNYMVNWFGQDDEVRSVSSGIYFIRYIIDGRVESMKKCMFLK